MSDRDRLLQDAKDLHELAQWLMKETGMDRESAERAIIHSGYRQIETLFAAYIKARGENSAQLKGLVDRILKGK